MVLIKEIELELSQRRNVPEAIEDTLIKDSVIDLANADFSKVDEFEDLTLGEIRRKIIVDSGYSGKSISRKKYYKSNLTGDRNAKNEIGWVEKEDEEDCLEHDDVSSEGSSKECNDTKSDTSVILSDHDNEASSENYDDDDDDDASDRETVEEEEETESEGDIEDESGSDLDLAKYQAKDSKNEDLNIFSSQTKDTDSEVSKGRSVKHQLNIWENLLEGRIKMQSCVISANKLYQKDDFSKFKSKLKPEDESVLSNTYSSLGRLMKILLELQELLLNSSPEYVNMSNKIKENEPNSANNDSDNESISSSLASGKEEEEEMHDTPDVRDEPKNKKIKLGHYSDHLEEIYTNLKPFKDKIIQTWNDKTRMSSGKISNSDFSAFDQPTIKQIEQILLDKNRLIKKTQLKRSDYNILGKVQTDTIHEDNSVTEQERTQKEYDPEIFDDDDYYHKLLRDFIERKSSDVTDSGNQGRKWLEIQHLRSKMKRKVDTRCTKGRKLRFTVHNKLVNFMAPIPSNTWNDEAVTQLFKSLFGKTNES